MSFALPIVAIVGRPNVGKSALFNRLVGRRVSIVHRESGVTRDRVTRETAWGDQRFALTDTGGLGLMDGATAHDAVLAGAVRQVNEAIQQAAVIIQVVDITAGLHPLDTEVARLLHRSGRPTLLAANKADHEGLDLQAIDFEELGFPVFAVSAIHDRGVGPLMDAVVARLPRAAEAERTPPPLNVAVVGRPNVGKSSYINRLLRSERVVVSPVPGTTRDSVEVPFVIGPGPRARRYVLIDTAGVRARGKAKTAVEKFSLMRTEESIRRADLVVLMLDAVLGPGVQDKRAASFVLAQRKGCLLLVNKWDLAEGKGLTQKEYGEALHRAIPFLDFAPIVFASAKSGYNVRRSIDAIDHVATQVRARIATGALNRVLHGALARTQPPLVHGKRLKLYYAVQTAVQPVTVRLFVNDPRCVTDAYRSYLVRALRKAFGLEGAPVVLRFSARHEGRLRRPAKQHAHRARNDARIALSRSAASC